MTKKKGRPGRGRESKEGRFQGILRLDYCRGVEVEECVRKAGTPGTLLGR
jgi:hypothetical protein